MEILDWVGKNGCLAIVLVILLGSVLTEVVKYMFQSGSRKAWKCPNCGHKK